MRTKPLPDLFAPALPKEDAGNTPVPLPAVPVVAAPQMASQVPQLTTPQPPAVQWPTVHGSIRSGAKRLVIVSVPQGTKVCAAGDWLADFYIAYVHEWAVGIQNGAETREFPL